MRRVFKAQEYIAHEIFLYYSGRKHKGLPGITEFSNTDIEQRKKSRSGGGTVERRNVAVEYGNAQTKK